MRLRRPLVELLLALAIAAALLELALALRPPPVRVWLAPLDSLPLHRAYQRP